MRFLYSSTVEPIFVYGCSVWASVLRTKAGVKKIRSFQRIICRVITRSFKTVPTESLILLSNLLSLDLRILEISSFRLFSQSPGEFFTNSSRKFILQSLQSLPDACKGNTVARASLLDQLPPWRIILNITNLSYASIALLPNAPNTLRSFIRVYQYCEATVFCAVFSDSIAVISI